MGKPQQIFNQGSFHTFWVNSRGELCEAYGEHQEHLSVVDTDYEPHADVTISRLIPGPPDNAFYTYYGVSAAHVGGDGMRLVRWVGRDWKPADHWEGPWATFS